MAEKRPTYDWAVALWHRRESALSGLHAAMREDEDYRLWASVSRGAARVYLSGLPDGYVPSYPPHAQAATQTGVNRMVSGEEPDVTLTFPEGAFNDYPEANREAAERKAREKYIRWVRASCKQILGKQVENIARDMGGQELALGQAVVTYPIDYSNWPDPPFGWLDVDEKTGEKKPAPPREDTPANRDKLRRWQRKRRRTYPWASRSIHPTWCFWDVSNDPPRDYVLVEKVSPASQAERFPGVWPDSEELTLERVTYISDEWAGQWVDGRSCIKGAKDGVVRNESGQPWVQMAFSGMGSQDSEARWVHRVKGSIRDGRDVLLLMAKAWNWMAAMGEQNAFPAVIGTREVLEQMEGGASAAIEVTEQGRLPTVFDPPRTPEQVYRLWEIATAMFALQFGADVLRGEFKNEPMGSLRTRATLAGMPFESPKVSLEQAWGAMFEHKLEMIKYVLMEPVTVGGVTMRPSDVIEGTQIKIDMTPLTEEEKVFKRTAAQDDVLKLKAMTVEDYIRTQRSIDDATAVMQAVAVEDLRTALLADPETLALTKQLWMQEMRKALGMPDPAPVLEPADGMVDPSVEEAAMDPMATQGYETEMQPPAPTLGSGGEAMQYAQAASGAPPVTLPRQAVQAGA